MGGIPTYPLFDYIGWQSVTQYGGKEISIILTAKEAQFARHYIRTHNPNVLPLTQRDNVSLSTTANSNQIGKEPPFLQQLFWRFSLNWKVDVGKRWAICNGPTTTISEGRPAKEVHLCTDRPWTSIRETVMSTISSVDTMRDDEQFFLEVRKVLVRCQGSRWQRLLSLKSYKQISLSKVVGLIYPPRYSLIEL